MTLPEIIAKLAECPQALELMKKEVAAAEERSKNLLQDKLLQANRVLHRHDKFPENVYFAQDSATTLMLLKDNNGAVTGIRRHLEPNEAYELAEKLSNDFLYFQASCLKEILK